MRIWDLPPEILCRQHLLGEHRELHAIWSILTNNKKGYANHPETLRWKGKLKALYMRHEAQVKEMERRGYGHFSPMEERLAVGAASQDFFVDSLEDQLIFLKNKGCECNV